MRYPGATEKSPPISLFCTWGQGHQRPSWTTPFVMITRDYHLHFVMCSLMPTKVSHPGLYLWLWVLPHSSLVILKGASDLGLTSGSYSLLAHYCKVYFSNQFICMIMTQPIFATTYSIYILTNNYNLLKITKGHNVWLCECIIEACSA